MSRDLDTLLGREPAAPRASGARRSEVGKHRLGMGTVLLAIGIVCALMAAFTPVGAELEWAFASATQDADWYRRFASDHPASRHAQEAHWRSASLRGDADSIAAYLTAWPEGAHGAEARQQADTIQWAAAKNENTVAALRAYAAAAPAGGAHVAEAAELIDALEWQTAREADTVRVYDDYLSLHRADAHAAEADERIAALRSDASLVDQVLQDPTREALEAFLANYPGHVNESVVRETLREIAVGRDIVDLLAERRIEVRASGGGIESVTVEIRRLAANVINVHVPVGTYFDSHSESAQNMVTTASASVLLADDEWQEVYLPAACANRPLSIPDTGDRFTVRRAPQQKELEALMPALEQANANFETRQAAVWVVTDNASYDELGILVNGPFGGRVIGEPEAAQALQVLHGAGIDITRKRLWRDRDAILAGLAEGALRDWLAQLSPRPN